MTAACTYNRNLAAAQRQAALGWRPAARRAARPAPAARSSCCCSMRRAGPVTDARGRSRVRAADQRRRGFRSRAAPARSPATTAAAFELPLLGAWNAARSPSGAATTCSCTSSGSCCADHGHRRLPRCRGRAEPRQEPAAPPLDVAPFVRREAGGGANVLHLMVEGVHCGACVRKIERALEREGGLETGAGQPDHAPADAALARRARPRQPARRRGGRARLRRRAVRPGSARGAGPTRRARAAALRRRRGLRRQQRHAARGRGLGRPRSTAWATATARPSCTGSRR